MLHLEGKVISPSEDMEMSLNKILMEVERDRVYSNLTILLVLLLHSANRTWTLKLQEVTAATDRPHQLILVILHHLLSKVISLRHLLKLLLIISIPSIKEWQTSLWWTIFMEAVSISNNLNTRPARIRRLDKEWNREATVDRQPKNLQ